jgi:DNA-binding response OmpR family regulator
MPFQLLAYLAARRGQWIKQETLLKEVFGARRAYDTALVRVHVHAIRRALGDSAPMIESQRGRGYRCAPGLVLG